MRVIAGTLKSRRLKTLPGAATRPTSDRLRETLFNVLGASIQGALFADCYAGSGAVGIEALSRGAEFVYFLESHRAAVRAIHANLKSLGLEEGYEVLAVEVAAGFRSIEQRGVRFDFVFLDPPYKYVDEYARTLALLGESNLLAPGAVVVAEHHRKQALADRYAALARSRTLRQGDSTLSFYKAG